MVSNIKTKFNYKNILFLMVCVVLAHFGLYYGLITNVRIMLLAGTFILARSIYLRKLPFDINLMFLFVTFIIKAMLDQHTGKAWKVPNTLAMPVLMYLLGKFLVAVRSSEKTISVTKITPEGPVRVQVANPLVEKTKGVFSQAERAVLAFGATALGMTYYGFLNYRLTHQNPMISDAGLYYLAFKDGQFSTINTFLFPFIPVMSFFVAAMVFAFYKLATSIKGLNKCKHLIILGLFVVISILAIWTYLHDPRWAALKEGARLMVTQHWGNFAFTVFERNSSSNMWLDYGRESGIMVLVPLLIFWGLTIKDAILLSFNKYVDIFTKTLLLVGFTLFNVYYFIEEEAFNNQYYWFFGLAISGAISIIRLTSQNTIKKD